jgi:hypothetical protein
VHSGSVDRTALVSFTSREVETAERDRGARKLVDTLATGRSVAASPLPAPEPAAEQPKAASSESNPAQRIAAYALLAGSVISAGMAVVSFVEVRGAQRDPQYANYRLAVGDSNPSVHDVCSEADAGRRYGLDATAFHDVKSSCRTGKTFEVLQFVFIGGALLTGGLATYLLVDDASQERESTAGLQFKLMPNIGRRSVSLSARLRF